VFSTDAELDVGAGLAAALDGDLDHLADTFPGRGWRRILLIDAFLAVDLEERPEIVARHASVVWVRSLVPKREAGGSRRLRGLQTGARQLDHGADHILDAGAGFL